MASANHVRLPKNITSKSIIKIWHIDNEIEKITLDFTSQSCGRVDNPEPSQNYITNYQMKCCKREK